MTYLLVLLVALTFPKVDAMPLRKPGGPPKLAALSLDDDDDDDTVGDLSGPNGAACCRAPLTCRAR